MSTHNIHFMIKCENFPKISHKYLFFGSQENFQGTKKRVRISHSKRAIGVRVIEILLYSVQCRGVYPVQNRFK